MLKKVLVTGARGFIGSHLVDGLLERGYEVIATDLAEAPKDFLNPKAIFLPADLSSVSEIFNLFQREELREVRTVFHVGALFDFFPTFDIMYKNNVLGTLNICYRFNRLPGYPKRLILFSSGVVSSPILRSSNYGRTKVFQEGVLEIFKSDFEGIIVRPAAVVGPRSRYGAAKILEMVAGGQLQFFVGRKNLRASLVHVDDVVGAVIHLAEAEWWKIKFAADAVGERVPIFDLVDDSSYSYEELISLAADLLRKTHGSRILSMRLPVWLMKIAAYWQEFLAKTLKTRPKLPVDMLDFFRAEMKMDNSALKKTGYVLEYPDSEIAIFDAVSWYLSKGWI